MMGYIEAPRAWALTRGMARSVGLDLVGAVVEGWLSRAELADLVERCEACDQSQRCTSWLAVTLDSKDLPTFCPNARALHALQP
ncbi:DUF6455 family protein [Stagnihabitans tardus]|uniref:DUF6455 domain-containing protein n=1 Tax=Stagnihabitans tardus TaxID=2699202 RepID=A0AAE4YC37_9RHOB|nr:DUF6455 family protein [Stagnihabitans tardus]NBZ86940.1 hypothetical protein [Stagnihabitans tardus]